MSSSVESYVDQSSAVCWLLLGSSEVSGGKCSFTYTVLSLLGCRFHSHASLCIATVYRHKSTRPVCVTYWMCACSKSIFYRILIRCVPNRQIPFSNLNFNLNFFGWISVHKMGLNSMIRCSAKWYLAIERTSYMMICLVGNKICILQWHVSL